MAPTGERGRGQGRSAPRKKKSHQRRDRASQNSGGNSGAANLKPFAPGQSGNPGGRPSTKWIREYLSGVANGKTDKTWREAYMEALCKTAVDRKHRDHVKAGLGLMAYDFGKPVQAMELTGKDGKPIETSDASPVRALTSEQRLSRITQLLAKAAGAEPQGTSPAPQATQDEPQSSEPG